MQIIMIIRVTMKSNVARVQPIELRPASCYGAGYSTRKSLVITAARCIVSARSSLQPKRDTVPAMIPMACAGGASPDHTSYEHQMMARQNMQTDHASPAENRA